ncbi:hypothetical protein JXQ70_11990, partial [bacterium]|nr:hypothetical protein [bacterium]
LIRHLRADTLLSIGAHFGLARYSSVNSVITRIGVLRDHNEHINHRIENILSLLKKSQEET